MINRANKLHTVFEVKQGFVRWLMLESYCGGKKYTFHNLKPSDILGFKYKTAEYIAIKLKKDKDNDIEYNVLRSYIAPYIHILG